MSQWNDKFKHVLRFLSVCLSDRARGGEGFESEVEIVEWMVISDSFISNPAEMIYIKAAADKINNRFLLASGAVTQGKALGWSRH